MKRAATVALALGAVIGAGLSPAMAQVVVGGSDQPDVQVNWSVLERLGPAPTLADMLRADIPATSMRSVLAPAGAKAEPITFQPYGEPKTAVARKAAPAVAKAEPAPAPSPAVAELSKAAEAARAEAKAEPAKSAATKAAPAVAKAESAPARPPKPEVAEQVPAAVPAAPQVAPAATPGAALASAEAPAPAEAPAAAVAPPESVKPDSVKPESVKPASIKPAEPTSAPVVAQASPPPTPAPAPAPIPAAPAVSAQPPAPATAASVATPAPAPAPAAQVAALPSPAPAAASSGGDTMSILFTGDAARLPDTARPALEKLAARLETDEGLGLQLLAYADGDDASASKARRLSLSRALEVRKFLMDQGVRSTRIEVRALGNKSDGGPADRVDAILVAR